MDGAHRTPDFRALPLSFVDTGMDLQIFQESKRCSWDWATNLFPVSVILERKRLYRLIQISICYLGFP